MEKFIVVILTLIAMAIVFFTVCIVVSAIRYLCEEVNHTLKNFKRSVREAWWDLEWRFTHH